MIDKSLIQDVPSSPGVYLWKDAEGHVIYVGKAKNLKARMSQYFDKKMMNSYKTPKMLEKIASFSTIVLSSEREAFIQERKLIDYYRPFYNVLFPTQATFPYIRVKLLADSKLVIDIKNNYHKEKNAIYYGPLPNNKNFKPLLRYLNHLLLSEDGLIIKNHSPEFAKAKFEEAKEIMKFGLRFKKELDKKIDEAIENNMFEAAKFYNDILDLLNYNEQEQKIFIKSRKSIDVFGFFEAEGIMLVHVMSYREGTLLNQQDFTLEIKISIKDFINEFLNEFYANNSDVDEILIDQKYQDILEDDNDFNITFPSEQSSLESLVQLANENAKNNIKAKLDEFNSVNKRTLFAQQKLSSYLHCPSDRIVMFDNSFLKGTQEVIGGAAYFKEGVPFKKFYRFYNLDKNQLRNADVEYMRQTSLNYLKDLGKEIDVIIADGGMAQMHEIQYSMKQLNLNIPIFGLIKNEKHETDCLIDINGNIINITERDVFDLLARMQYEVDRFVKNMYNRKQNKTMLNNPLLNIPGIGPKTVEKLLAHFGSYAKIKEASEQELQKVTSAKIAKIIFENNN
ncbi:GIY-YIG nuclease family protein [Metamycoplasma neophronis]|uniref:Excinuclease ABC subunit C n=1 Tax=Metamycoplasma neophronis TaxID=872983 RepID=A0ABY2YZW6_9BACT|nr:GIY-YIG nuclease family protein [Metamycoplasma neophronis]TPR53259.1 excinuclease ABC subunit C [Metamycoplasma neophronis]